MYLWLDAKVERVRAGRAGRASCAGSGLCRRPVRLAEFIRLEVGAAETEAFGREFLRSLVRRGLAGVQLVGAGVRPSFRASSLEEARRMLVETVAHLFRTSPRPSPGPGRSNQPMARVEVLGAYGQLRHLDYSGSVCSDR